MNKDRLNKRAKYLKNWFARCFRVISPTEAQELGLKWYINLYGDRANKHRCRSFWIDHKGRIYRVSHTFDPKP